MRLLIFILLGAVLCDHILYQFFDNVNINVSFLGNPKWSKTGELITLPIEWWIDIIFSNKVLPMVMAFVIYKVSKNEVFRILGISIFFLYLVKGISFMTYYLEEYNIPALCAFFAFVTYYLSTKFLTYKKRNKGCQV